MSTVVFTFDSDVISDLYKDVYGYRPGNMFWEQWLDSSDQQKQEQWDRYCSMLAVKIAEDEFAEQLAVERFERVVATTIEAGAQDRPTALRWIMDSSGADGDWEFLAWESGLPARYFDKTA